MAKTEIENIKYIFLTRLDSLEHILSLGVKHFSDSPALLEERLAADMFPFGGQIVLACNQPRGFSQWCAGRPVENLDIEVDTLETAYSHIANTRQLVSGITVKDEKLDEIKRIGLGPGRYCELPARQYISDYLLPNLYFHIATAYAILRKAGVSVGKADFLTYLAPYVKETN